MRYWRNIARLSLFVFACAAGLIYVDYRVARASVFDRLIAIGERMAPYLDDGRGTEAPREIAINGIKIFVATGHTPHPPAFVRKWYADRYAQRGAGLDGLMQSLGKKAPPLAAGESLNQVSFGNDERGGMAALDFGESLSKKKIPQVLSLLSSGDLGSAVSMRYLWVERASDGGSRFLTAWTDSSFKLAGLGGAAGDAPGSDIADVPRFPGTARALSAAETGMPQKLAVYDGSGSPETAQLFYRARMPGLGWTEDESYSRLAAEEKRVALHFVKADREVVIDLGIPEAGQGLAVCVMQTR